MNLFPASFQSLERSLDASSLRQRTIASNIANVDTPNYKSKAISFENELAKELVKAGGSKQGLQAYRTNAQHIPFSNQAGQSMQPQVVQQTGTMMNHNGNNVDIDLEMAQMAKNQIQYQALVDKVNGHLGKLHSVISEGR